MTKWARTNCWKYGDSLFLQPGSAEPTRLQGAFVSDDEVHQVVNYVKSQAPADYIEGLLSGEAALETTNIVNPNAGSDELFDQAVAYILESKKTSISSLQRQLRIGYNRAANLMEALENAGVVSPADLNGSRRYSGAKRPVVISIITKRSSENRNIGFQTTFLSNHK